MPDQEIVTVRLYLTRETKGTFRYDTDDQDAAIRSQYIRKSAFGNGKLPPRWWSPLWLGNDRSRLMGAET